jgi:spectinomycin phosphotransferase
MKHDPLIKHPPLIAAARDAYRLPIDTLQFVPVGFAAACYRAHGSDGGSYFLKLWPDLRAGSPLADRIFTILRLTRTLHDRELLRVPYPLPTRNGRLWATWGSDVFAVFPWLDGQPPPTTTWPMAITDAWTRTIAALHHATPLLADVLLPRETFALPFEAELHRGLAAVAQIAPGARRGLRELRNAVLPRRTEIDEQLARLHRLQGIVRRLDGPFVLCHTDSGGDNLLVDDRGRLSVLDWDDATLAPPEHDLHEARWVDVDRVLARYLAENDHITLHLDHFAFALLRRFLADMTARLSRMLASDPGEGADRDLLDGIERWGFDQWRPIDDTLDLFAGALRRIGF